MNQEYYELRYIETSYSINSAVSLFDDAKNRITLLDLLKEYDRILLLGNPGTGKTTELREAFNKLWEKKEEENLIPLFINIKKFKDESTIEDLIGFDSWKKQPAIIFFFDGLDEIGNVQGFISKLIDFIADYAGLRLKFVMSCRTNIYQKYILNNLSNFQTAYIKDLSYEQINNILENKYELKVPEKEIEVFQTILQTPFNLNLFANYYTMYNQFPDSINESWKLLIDAEIKRAIDFFGEKFEINNKQIVTALKQVAITNELMQESAIKKEDLVKLVDTDGFEIFEELPFIVKQGTLNYAFKHKNYQEYFAAQYIAEFASDSILNFLKADDLDKIRPNLFNTTTFLLNILDGEKLETLKKWLLANDIEVLFFADEGQLDTDLQNDIFEKYFIETCIEKTHWISNNTKISVDTFAKFASFDFLMEQLTRPEKQVRIKGSALEVLAKKQLSEDQQTRLKEKILQLLAEKDELLLPELLRMVKLQGFHKNRVFLDLVIDHVKNLNNRGVYHQIISILTDLDDEELDADILILAIKNYYSTEDSVIRATEYLIASTILKTKDRDLNLSLIELLFDENYSLRSKTILNDNFNEKLLEKIKSFSSDQNYAKRLVEIVFGGQYRIMSHPLLKKIIEQIEFTPELVLHIISKENISRDVLYNISSFLDNEAIDAIANSYKTNSLKFDPPENITSFRNWIANADLSLGIYFQEKFVEAGYEFPVSLITQEEIFARNMEYEAFKQYNFNLLFDRELMMNEINKYFTKNNVEDLNNKEFQKLFWKWYDELSYHGIQYTLHTVLETAFREYKSINLESINKLLQDSFHYLSVIKSALNHSSLQSFQLGERHVELIKSLTLTLANKINFNDVIRIDLIDRDIFYVTQNFNFLKLVLYFESKFNIILDKEFYLKSLKFANLENALTTDGNTFIDHILSRVDDKKAVDERIVQNIKEGDLIAFAKVEHIQYAIDNNLNESFEKIGLEILDDNSLISQGNILEKYIEKIPNALDFLKTCCVDPESYFYWYVIRLIKKDQLDNAFILNAALEYLGKEDMKYIEDAINILFFLNQKNALTYYYNALIRIIKTKQDSSGILPKDVNKYNNLEELDLFEKMFDLIYSPSPFGSFYLYQSRRFMSIVTVVLSGSDKGYWALKEIFENIKSQLKIETIDCVEDCDHKIFYLNELIDFSYNSYLKSKSEKLSFDQAISFLNPLN